MGKSFTHLHLHTEYSMLDGASRIKDVVAAAVADGQPAVGITDHGNMYGVLPMYQEARKQGIKPIIGTEAYFVATSRRERPRRAEHEIYHLTLLAETTQGYQNLIKVSSYAYLEGFYYKPRSDWELLESYHKGLIATSGCLGGLIAQQILNGDITGAESSAARFQDIFGRDSFFLEVQDHGLKEDRVVNAALVEMAGRIDAPLLATNDSHYTHRHEAEAHDALLCVQTGSNRDDVKRLRFEGEEFYLKSADEMRALFAEIPESCDNTLWIAERSEVEIPFGRDAVPIFPVPQGYTEDSYLKHLTYEGARERYGDVLAAHVTERIDFELGVITAMGFSSYFLVVWDLVRYAHESHIRVGPGRGSAAGSCVAFCLRIVDIDPIRYDLLFERFLNPGRKEMPDIDMDFDDRYRGDMIRYASERYGWDHVAQIITFSTIKARAAVRDASRVLGYPYIVGDKIAKLMPPLIMGRDTSLTACFEKSADNPDGYKMAKELRDLYEADPDAKRVVDVARGIENLRRQDGIHAAAVVITREPVMEYVPIQRKPDASGSIESAPIVTQYEMHAVEELGLLKMDFLGLRNLSTMERTLELIEISGGGIVDIDHVALDDELTFELLRRADTLGVFQLESTPMRALMRSLAPTVFEDVCALVALYRPGPMAANMHTDYADRKNGRKPVTFYHEDLTEILAPTYGLMIYQEQLMRVAQRLAGYSLEEADNLRKATGKKDRERIAKERTKFIEGCVTSGYERSFGESMFNIIEPFADYSFNKSHSFGYGLVAYQNAYLKAHFRVEYLAALLTSIKGDKDKTAIYLGECRALGIRVIVPDVNSSLLDFAVLDGTIPFGLSAIRNVGEGVSSQLIAERNANGAYADFYDFAERVDVSVLNKKTIESLIKAGAFDALGHPRRGLLMVFESIIEQTLKRRRERESGAMSLFDVFSSEAGNGSESTFDERVAIPDREFGKAERLVFEKEMLGLYISEHPLMGVERSLSRQCDATVLELKELTEGEFRVAGGVVTALSKRFTKAGQAMATFLLEDLQASIEVMVFPKTMATFGDELEEDEIVCVKGKVDNRDDSAKFIAMEISRPRLTPDSGGSLRLRFTEAELTPACVVELKEILVRHRGTCPVIVEIKGAVEVKVLKLGDDFSVEDRDGLYGELRVHFGPGVIAE